MLLKYLNLKLMLVTLIIGVIIMPNEKIYQTTNNECNWISYGQDYSRKNSVMDFCAPKNEIIKIWEVNNINIIRYIIVKDTFLYFIEDDESFRSFKINCYSIYDGKVKWQRIIDNGNYTTLNCYRDGLWLVHIDGEIEQYNYVTGDLMTKIKIQSQPLVNNTSLIENNLYYKDGNVLKCFDITNNVIKWSVRVVDNIVRYAIQGDNIYIAPSEDIVFCVNRFDGKTIWTLDEDRINFSGQINTLIATANNRVFLFRNISKIFCINKDNGNTIWVHEDGRITSGTLSSSIDEKNMYYSSKNTLNCLDITSGSVRWEQTMDSDVINNTSTQKLVYASTKTSLYKINSNDGVILSKFGNGGELLAIAYGKIFVLKDNTLICYGDRPETLSYTLGEGKYKADQEEREIDTPPSIINSRTYLPAKYVVEPLGGSVTWDAKDKKVTCILGDKTIELWVNNPTATVNGKQLQIDPNNPKVTPIIMNGRTMVPVRFLAENLGCEVKWIAETKTIILTYKP